mmetsp:Transcript_21096/g.66276  ORF Transcript_21096/g.66276 Transcript_21096/m.66276 type:complete len:214 (-) Transcript_21096:178-819(-)
MGRREHARLLAPPPLRRRGPRVRYCSDARARRRGVRRGPTHRRRRRARGSARRAPTKTRRRHARRARLLGPGLYKARPGAVDPAGRRAGARARGPPGALRRVSRGPDRRRARDAKRRARPHEFRGAQPRRRVKTRRGRVAGPGLPDDDGRRPRRGRQSPAPRRRGGRVVGPDAPRPLGALRGSGQRRGRARAAAVRRLARRGFFCRRLGRARL